MLIAYPEGEWIAIAYPEVQWMAIAYPEGKCMAIVLICWPRAAGLYERSERARFEQVRVCDGDAWG